MTTEPFVIIGRLIRLEVSASASSGTRVVVVVAEQGSTEHSVLTLRGVDSPKVSQWMSDWSMTIQIADIKDRQLEGINFSVTDPEQGILSCLCTEFSVGSETVSS